MKTTPANKASTREIYFRIRDFVVRAKLSWKYFIIAFVLSFLASLCEGISLSLLIPLIKGIINQDFSFVKELPVLSEITGRLPNYFPFGNRNFILLLIILTFTASVLKIVLQYLSRLLTSYMLRSFLARMREIVYQRLLSFGKLYFDKRNQGEIQQLLTNYTGAVANSLMNIQNGVYAAFTLCFYLIIMTYISWELTLIVLTIFPVLHYSLQSLIARISQTSLSYADHFNKLGRIISNTLSSHTLLKAYHNEDEEFRRFKEVSSSVEECEKSIDRKNLALNPLQELISLTFLFLLVGIIGYLISLKGEWNIANYMVFLLIMRRAAIMFGIFNGMRSSLAVVSGPIEHLHQVLQDEEKFFVRDGTQKFSVLRDGISFQNLTYSYGNDKPALKNINFQMHSGEVTALVGASGAGKSTLMNLLMRFYEPPAGTLFADGVDINNFTLESWRRSIAYVSQDAQLFHGTLKENICYGLRHDVADDTLKEVLAESHLDELTHNLSDGLDTLIGDRGVKLSGGEKQRVSIARALLKNADILLLDEATSALDSRTEQYVQDSLTRLMSGKTTLVIAHRLFTIRHADNILVLENGELVESGSLEKLLEKKGIFFNYWEQQKFY